MRHSGCLVLVMAGALALVMGNTRAENIVSYRVSTSCVYDWDIVVNGVTVVRHRPTGFGMSLYSGSLNRVVTNGVNTVSFLSYEKPDDTAEKASDLSLEVDFVVDYKGQQEYGRLVSLLRYQGSPNANLSFTIDRAFRRIESGRISSDNSDGARGWVYVLGGIAYVFFANLFGFFMVVNDKQHVRDHLPRIPQSRFVGNALLGGGVGLLIGVVVTRHRLNRQLTCVLIPALIFFQFVLGVIVLTPLGGNFTGVFSRNKPGLTRPLIFFNEKAEFLDALRNHRRLAE